MNSKWKTLLKKPIMLTVIAILLGFVVAIIIMGIGDGPDAAAFGDTGADTLGHISDALGGTFLIPNLAKLGLANLKPLSSVAPVPETMGYYAKMAEKSRGKDTMCLQREMPSPDNPSGQCAYLMNIYTRPDYRGRGIGGAVVSFLIAEARKRQITKVYLEAAENAVRFYRKLGFEPLEGYMPEHRFVAGVQWHPEFSYKKDENSARLIKAFADSL